MAGGSSAETHYLLGSAALEAGNTLEALENLSKALELNPKLPSLRAYYGQALLSTGDADGAVMAFDEALADDPNDFDAHYHLASILATRRQVEEARPHAERALQLRPRSQEVRELLESLDDPDSLPRFDDSSPLVGQQAPDVVLQRLDGSAYRLSALRGRPVLLAFGSYTCPWFRHGAPFLNRLHERYGDRVEFRMVYIREAHPEGGEWESTINQRDGVSLPVARSMGERAEHAAVCRRSMDVAYETTLDAMDGAAEEAFDAYPSRAFVIDREGTVTFSTGLDEQRLHEEAVEAALESVLR
jgi:tetratricopeptide (TPR) repeat protein